MERRGPAPWLQPTRNLQRLRAEAPCETLLADRARRADLPDWKMWVGRPHAKTEIWARTSSRSIGAFSPKLGTFASLFAACVCGKRGKTSLANRGWRTLEGKTQPQSRHAAVSSHVPRLSPPHWGETERRSVSAGVEPWKFGVQAGVETGVRRRGRVKS